MRISAANIPLLNKISNYFYGMFSNLRKISATQNSSFENSAMEISATKDPDSSYVRSASIG